ncbi:MAG: hypothetical protein JSW04_15995 [Desulfobacterales bacterium]|nr:MAG: hypothetical protein JSV38_08430 [Desulfobacterales bacterium]UCD89860.1 MAG: hypothetical protein JSW04_15995 [Desulfobacterales bacterium]
MEKLDKRFGIVAIESGFITPEQLIEAMQIQVYEDIEGTKHRLIGEILREKGYITEVQIDDVIKSMRF